MLKLTQKKLGGGGTTKNSAVPDDMSFLKKL
jgi:hypothetical protein